MNSKNPLHKQLEQQKFEHAVLYVSNSSRGIKKLTSSELSHLNQLLTGAQEETWRLDSTEVQLPTGKKVQFNLVNNPISLARDIIGNAFQKAGNQEIFEAASYLYSQLVLWHLFKDANRRTAVLATLWLLQEFDVEINAEKLHHVPIGDLRDPSNLESLAQRIRQLKN